MATDLRKTGISVVGDVPWGTHFCHFYETKQDLLDTLVPYFKAGLESKEFCLWVVSNPEILTAEEAKGALAQAVPDLDRHLSEKNIEIVDWNDWYFEKNALSLERARSGWDAKLKRARARGYDGLRASADTFWLAEKDWKDFFAYEKQVDDWITNQSMTVMCTYPLARSGANEVFDVVQAHQFAIARRHGEWDVIETPELIQARAEIKRLNQALQTVIERTPKPALILRYGLAALSVVTALIVALWMASVLHSSAYVSLLLCAVMLSTWFGGVRPGLLATALSILAFAYALPPNYSLTVEPREIPRLLIFALSTILVWGLSGAQKSRAESLRHTRDLLNDTVQEQKRTNVALQAENAERKRVEQRLREYEKTVEGLDEMIVVVDRDYRYVMANRAFLKYRGLELQQFVGRLIPEVMNPGVFENIAKPRLDESFAGQIVKYEMSYDYPVLGQRDLSISYFPIEGPSGVDRVACILKDITETKRAEEALRSSETKLRRLLDSSIVGVVFWDLQGSVLGANDLFLNMIGYTRMDLEQGRLSWKDITPPEYTHVDEQAIAELLATGNCTPFEKEYIRKDGSRVSVMIGAAMLEGQKDTGSSFIMDITERKRVEEQLQQSEERFRQMAESITEVFWMTNPDKSQIMYVSPGYEKIWGRSRQSVSEQPTTWLDAVHPDDRQRVEIAVVNQQIMGGYDEEYRIIQPNGSVRWVRDRAFPIDDAHGHVYRITGIAEDITERKLAEEQLRATTGQLRALSARLQSAREEEATRIAREIHDELGGTLTSLRWDLEDLDDVASETGSQLDLQERRKKIGSMMSVIDTTITTVRRIASELRPIGLDDLGLVAAIDLHARKFQDRSGIIVECDCTEQTLKLSQDQSTAVFRIFQEALTNILRHARATKVTIQTQEENEAFILTIIDNGRGITDDEKSGQFTFGLLGMRERAHLVGGRIEIKAHGKGTLVSVRIPIAASEPESRASQ